MHIVVIGAGLQLEPKLKLANSYSYESTISVYTVKHYDVNINHDGRDSIIDPAKKKIKCRETNKKVTANF